MNEKISTVEMELTCNNLPCVPTVDREELSFSWVLKSHDYGREQIAYRICVSSDLGFKNIFWDSGKCESSESANIKYCGESLNGGNDYFWFVTIWTDKGYELKSNIAQFRTGIEKWTADWITPNSVNLNENAPLLRKCFKAENCTRAVLYIFSQGWYEVYINGQKADDRVLAPNYAGRFFYFYDTYDLTDKINSGENCIGFWLGSGYSYRNFSIYAWRYRGQKRIIAELHLEFADGSKTVIPTDESWLALNDSAITFNNIYDGETFNSTFAEDYFSVNYNAKHWHTAKYIKNPLNRKLKPSGIPYLRVTEHLAPIKCWNNKDGDLIVDFGQNFAGWVKLKLKNTNFGDEIKLKFAECIDENGELDTFSNRYANPVDKYICSGKPFEEFEPRFTYHGFRYTKISGCEFVNPQEQIIGCVVHCDLGLKGDFKCDYEPLNKLFGNIKWSMRSNAMSYMSDCPAREERTPCLMDSAPIKEMSAFIFKHSAPYWKQWMSHNLKVKNDITPDWCGTIISICYHLYKEYGDIETLKNAYNPALKVIKQIEKNWNGFLVKERFGDWCAPKPQPEGNYLSSFAYITETSTALFYRETVLMIKICGILGKEKEVPYLEKLAKNIKTAYHNRFYNSEEGYYSDGNLTASVLPLYFGMVPKKLVERVYNRVKKMITDENSGHLDTGIFGTKYLSLLLSDNGDMDLLLDTYFIPTYPSFGYQFSKNATTLWEQWSDTKGDMLSFNHAMFAGAGAFIPKGVLGIQVENIRKVKIKPSMSSKINFAKGCYPTLLGDYKIDWHIKKGCFYLTLEIPFNCEAELTLPDKSIYNLKAGRHSLSCKLEEEYYGN